MSAWLKTFLAALGVSIGAWACTTESGPVADGPEPVEIATFELEYPDAAALFEGEHGIYRGCAPNEGVCHNSRQYPDLRQLGAMLDHIGRPCNRLRDDPADVHDWCEGSGDLLISGRTPLEIGYLEPVDAEGREWIVHVRREPPPNVWLTNLVIARPEDDGYRPLYEELNEVAEVSDASVEGAPAVRLRFEPWLFEEYEEYGQLLVAALESAGTPGHPGVIRVGDPNRNGVYGADLDNGLIVPGAPERSYLVRRLIDPEFGTLMPLANCCFWSREALRGLWCWIAGLDADGANALDPIDYESCPDGPVASLDYPEPGPSCEADGLCPVSAVDPLAEGPTWRGVSAILRRSCSGTACHVGGRLTPFTIPFADADAYDAVLDRLRPGHPDSSMLMMRLDPDVCRSPDCELMPRGGDPLPDEELELIRDWIVAGAPPG